MTTEVVNPYNWLSANSSHKKIWSPLESSEAHRDGVGYRRLLLPPNTCQKANPVLLCLFTTAVVHVVDCHHWLYDARTHGKGRNIYCPETRDSNASLIWKHSSKCNTYPKVSISNDMVKLTQRFKSHTMKASHKVSMMDIPQFLENMKRE